MHALHLTKDSCLTHEIKDFIKLRSMCSQADKYVTTTLQLRVA